MKHVIKTIDQSLEFKEKFYGSNYVCKVEKEGCFYILKFSYENNIGSWLNIRKEADLLERAKHIQGITHLVKDYDRGNLYAAILKEYAEGQDLYALGGGRITEKHLQKQLEQTVLELHDLNIAGIDIRFTNVVISPDRSSAKIIDLDHYTCKKDLGIFSSFKSLKKEDFRRLKKLFG